MENTLGLQLLGIFFTALGGFGAGLMIRNVYFAKTSRHWPSTDGRILSVDVEVVSGGGDSGGSHYSPKVQYEYFIDGTRYTGETIDFTNSSDEQDYQKAQRRIQNYERGQEVNVYFDPSKPERSVLRPGVHGLTHVFILGGSSVFIASGIGILLGSFF